MRYLLSKFVYRSQSENTKTCLPVGQLCSSSHCCHESQRELRASHCRTQTAAENLKTQQEQIKRRAKSIWRLILLFKKKNIYIYWHLFFTYCTPTLCKIRFTNVVHSKNTFCTCQREHPQWDSPSTPAALPHANSPRGQEDGQSRGCKGQPLPHTETTHCEQVLLYCAQKRGGSKHCCNKPLPEIQWDSSCSSLSKRLKRPACKVWIWTVSSTNACVSPEEQ